MPVTDRLHELGTFCALTPVADAASLRGELAGWGDGSDSPFARLAHVHFARFVVIDGLRREVAAQPEDVLERPLLMFSAFADGDPARLPEAVCDALGEQAHAVWRHCHGYPGDPRTQSHAFLDWLRGHRIPAAAVFGAYPEATVERVRAALAFRERFRAFAFDLERRRSAQSAFAAFAREGRS